MVMGMGMGMGMGMEEKVAGMFIRGRGLAGQPRLGISDLTLWRHARFFMVSRHMVVDILIIHLFTFQLTKTYVAESCHRYLTRITSKTILLTALLSA